MPRREFPAKVKVAAFKRADGRCEECTALLAGICEYDHRIPDQLGGEPTLENCVVLCKSCHRAKTSTQDAPRIAKAKRAERTYIGAKAPSRRPLRHPYLKKKLDGTVVPR